MKKTITLILALAFITLSLLSCSNKSDPNAPNGFVTASDKACDYYLYVPSEWTVDTAENSLMASARADNYSTTPANITMMPFTDDEDKYKTISEYWAYYESTIANVFDKAKDENGNPTEESSCKIISKDVSCKVDGRDGMKYVYTATLDGINLKYLQLIVKKDSSFHILTYTASADSYDENEINAIINEIKFKAE